MKRSNHVVEGAIPLLMTAVLCAFTPGLPAQRSNSEQDPRVSSNRPRSKAKHSRVRS